MNVLIICAGNNLNRGLLKKYAQNADYIICADGGYNIAKENGIKPNIVVGDFDSSEKPDDFFSVVELPREKDETDGLYALKFAVSKKANKIIFYAGLGNRYDHSYTNMCLLNYALERDIEMVLTDGKTEIYMTDSFLEFEKEKGTAVSVYSFSDFSYNVNLVGLKYPLIDYNLSKYDIIGTSNEFVDATARISTDEGKLMVIITN